MYRTTISDLLYVCSACLYVLIYFLHVNTKESVLGMINKRNNRKRRQSIKEWIMHVVSLNQVHVL